MANKPLKSIKFPGLDDTYTVPQIDDTLTVTGKAADAAATGELKNELNLALVRIGDEELYKNTLTFEQGQFTWSGDSATDYWIRSVKTELLDNDFVLYNPDGFRWSIGVYNASGTFQGYAPVGTTAVADNVYTDTICHVNYRNDLKYRIRAARTTAVTLSPNQSHLTVYRKYLDKSEIEMKGRYRKPTITLSNALIYHKVGSASGTEGAIYNTDNYRLSNVIELKNGETIRAYGGGAATMWLMAEFNSAGTQFVQGLVLGDREYHIYEYTANHDMFVRICGQTVYYSTGQNPVVTESNLINDTIIFYRNQFYSDEIKASPLYGKTITGMGDSLMYGSLSGNGASWLHLLALKYNMTENNLGINGNAFASGAGTGTPMCERYSTIPQSDIIVIEGGANDKGSDVPVGTVTDTSTTTFAGALNTVITGVRNMYPKATLLFLTDYNRYPSHYRAYADKMIEVCKYRSVPVFDNVSDANIALNETDMIAWQDEGMALTGTANMHISPEAYRLELLPKYEAKLLSLLGSGN